MTGKSKKNTEEEKENSEPIQEEIDELTAARELADQYLNVAKRIQADFDNYRKRTQKDMEEYRKHATDGLATGLLETLDDLDRAIASAKDPDGEFVQGILMVRQNLMKTLASYGIAEIPTDCKFDPKLHEALCTEEGEEDGDIAEVYQKGYSSGDRVLRYSKVKVTKAREAEKKTAGETAEEEESD
ncbi:MAG: nucleotide exchange factor GrpE [Candidatus Methanomethylophilaceae archaeon]|jgi:molecular chaperone GrpE